nr:hypothetical protein [Tanacetum cinerariifolium]
MWDLGARSYGEVRLAFGTVPVEESGVDEPKLGKPELGNLELDKLVLDKLEDIDQLKAYNVPMLQITIHRDTIKPSGGMLCQGMRKEIQTKDVIDDTIHFDALGDMQEFVKMLIGIITRNTMKLARIQDLLNHVILKSKFVARIAIGEIGPPRQFKDGWHNSSIFRSSGTG